MLNRSRLNQRGDSIVEVLIAIAVGGLVLAGSFYAINHESSQSEGSTERNEAIKIVESQIEDLRSYTPGMGDPALNSVVCFYYDGSSVTPETSSQASQPQGSNPCILDANGNEASANATPAYTVRISNDGASPTTTYTATVTWQGTIGTNTTSMEYRPQ